MTEKNQYIIQWQKGLYTTVLPNNQYQYLVNRPSVFKVIAVWKIKEKWPKLTASNFRINDVINQMV